MQKTILKNLNYADFLREHGIRPSRQRLAVYEYIWTHRTHPTAEIVYESLAPKIATLSRTTVYNTLRLFCECGVAQMIFVEENEMRFDANTNFHGHFKCTACGALIDFEVDEIAQKLPAGCKVSERHFYLRGLCPECAN